MLRPAPKFGMIDLNIQNFGSEAIGPVRREVNCGAKSMNLDRNGRQETVLGIPDACFIISTLEFAEQKPRDRSPAHAGLPRAAATAGLRN